MLSILFLSLAGMCNAIMDTLVFHWDTSIFKGSKYEWWANPEISYRNKWKNNSNSEDGEKFLGSSTIFVWVTDLWHFTQSFMISFFVLSALSYDGITELTDINWVNILIDFILLKLSFSLTFELFWSKLLKKR